MTCFIISVSIIFHTPGIGLTISKQGANYKAFLRWLCFNLFVDDRLLSSQERVFGGQGGWRRNWSVSGLSSFTKHIFRKRGVED
jgi:hypothetical protein